jgi:hypothetical protein
MNFFQQPTRPSGKLPVFVPSENKRVNPPTVSIGCVANIYVRQMCFTDVGHTEYGHKHNFDHLTLLAAGKLLVEVDNHSTVFTAPAMIYINKNINHKLTALEPNTVAYCVHGLRDKDISDDILSPEMIPNGVDMNKVLRQILKK